MQVKTITFQGSTAFSEREVEALLKLSGMEYHGYKHTPEEWEEITGVNPRKFPRLIEINKWELCGLTMEAKKYLRAYFGSRKFAMDVLLGRITPIEEEV
jgi:hypothetical protein